MIKWNTEDISDFSADEMRCRCGCGRADMDLQFMRQLQGLRDVVGPMGISSGYRCPDHNARVSRTGKHGPHTTGKAADVLIHGTRAFFLISIARDHGITGLGIAQKGVPANRFVHLDCLQSDETAGDRPWIWSY